MSAQPDGNELVKEFNDLITKISVEVALRSMNPELIDAYTKKISSIMEKCNSNVDSKIGKIPDLMKGIVLERNLNKDKEYLDALLNKIDVSFKTQNDAINRLNKQLDSVQTKITNTKDELEKISNAFDGLKETVSFSLRAGGVALTIAVLYLMYHKIF